MKRNTGVYTTTQKNGKISYRVSLTYRRKHISLGSYDNADTAGHIYDEGRRILDDPTITLESYTPDLCIPFAKYVILVNFRDNGIYFPTPIYLRRQYFEYYLAYNHVLKFDRDDLFFYASHKIQQRGGYLFVSDYGSQYKILSRYGIRAFAVYGRDYMMINNDRNDFRYSNIRILNHYAGVQIDTQKNKPMYTALIHINGNYIIGRYQTETEAAIAYNKAVDILHANGLSKSYLKNYITSLNKEEYKNIYDTIQISDKIQDFHPDQK